MRLDLRLPLLAFSLAICIIAVAACADPKPRAGCSEADARAIAIEFRDRLRHVPTTAPDSLLIPEIRRQFTGVVTDSLLAYWVSNPSAAPVRNVSSPWPERIDIERVETDSEGCTVFGSVVFVTSVEVASGGAAALREMRIQVVDDGDRARIAAFEWEDGGNGPGEAESPRRGAIPPPSGSEVANPDNGPAASPTSSELDADTVSDAEAAIDIIRRYYDAINAREFRRAYELWGGGGATSGAPYDEFVQGFAETRSVSIEIGEPSRIEGAAGSRYITIPVEIEAITTSGGVQRFQGTYTLRRSVVDGATAEQRAWRIQSADVEER